jgi:hypothetical protein
MDKETYAFFYMGKLICGRKSMIRQRIAAREAGQAMNDFAAYHRRRWTDHQTGAYRFRNRSLPALGALVTNQRPSCPQTGHGSNRLP